VNRQSSVKMPVLRRHVTYDSFIGQVSRDARVTDLSRFVPLPITLYERYSRNGRLDIVVAKASDW